MATCVRKSFYLKILKWQKVSHQDKKIQKVQICQNAPTHLSKYNNKFRGLWEGNRDQNAN